MQLPAFGPKQFRRILLAWMLPVAACLLQWVFWDFFEHYPWLLFFPATFFAARIGGLWGGIGATAISSLLVWWFFLPPQFSFAVDEISSPLAVAVFVATGIAFSIFDQALRQSQEQYRTLFDDAGDGIVRISRQGVVLAANDLFVVLAGRSRQATLGAQIADLVVDMTPQLWQEINAQLETDGALQSEHQLRQPGGALLPIEVTATRLHGGDHLVIVRDITRRKMAEAALQANEEKWRLVFDLLPVGVSIVDTRHNVTDTNPALAQILGLTAEGILAGAYRNRRYFHPDHTPMEPAEFPSLRTLREQQVIRNVEIGVEKEDGEIVWTSVSATPVSDSGYSATVTVDISERKRAELALRESEAKFTKLFQASPVALNLSHLESGTLVDVNEAFVAQYGYTRSELIGRRSTEIGLFSAATRALMREELGRQGRLQSVDLQVRAKSGEVRDCLISVETLDLATGPHLLVSTVDISERKRAEAALAAAAANVHSIIENTDDRIWSVDRNCCLLFANSAFQRNMQEQVGRTLAAGECVINETFTQDVRSFWQRLYERALAGEAFSLEFSSALQPGGILEMSLYPIRAAGGAVVGVAGRAVDVTERRQLEQVMAASEERLRWAMDATSEGLWDWDIVTGKVIGNDQWHRLFGYEPGEMPSTIDLWTGTLHPDDAAATFQVLNDYLQGRRSDYSSEHRIVTKGGEVRWHLSVGKVVGWDADGRPSRMVGTNADITERKLAELQLRHSEERFRFIVENAPIAIAIWGEDGALRYVSATVQSDLGVSPAELVEAMQAVQVHVADLALAEFTPEWLAETGIDDPVYARAGLRAVETVRYCLAHLGEKVWIEETLPHAGSGGEVDMQFIYQSFAYNTTGNEVVTVAYDISEHRALERLLRETNIELEQQVAVRTAQLQETVADLRRANAGKDAFLAAVSHELRTPIMGVLSMSELLESEERGPLNPDQARYAGAIVESGRRLLAAVNSILLYTQAMTGAVAIQREPCHLAELSAIAVRAAAAKAEHKQQRIACTVEPPDLEILSDAQCILNILKVLLDNAVKFTPAGGDIDLTVAAALSADGAAVVHFVVTDTGIGMSEEQIAGLFRPFAQGDLALARRFDGMGLGLAYAHKIAELLGGALSASSAPGHGACLTLSLPA